MDEFFPLAKKFSREDGDGRGAVSDFFVLGLGDIDEDLGGWVVDMHRAKDGGSVVGDSDVLVLGSCGNRDQDLVHAPGA